MIPVFGDAPRVRIRPYSQSDGPVRAHTRRRPRLSFTAHRTIDGDTLVVGHRGLLVTARLLGIDTPELARYGRDAEPGAVWARDLLARLVAGERLYGYTDTETALADRYDRNLLHLVRRRDGLWINHELVRVGAAYVYRRYEIGQLPALLAAEREAREAGRGLWSLPTHIY